MIGEVCVPFSPAFDAPDPTDPEILSYAREAAAKAGGVLGEFIEERKVIGFPALIFGMAKS